MRFSQLCWLTQILLLPLVHGYSYKFTKVECKALDPTYVEFKKCELLKPRRGVNSFSMDATPLKKPMNDILCQVSLFRKSKIYQPFLINYTVDFCQYMRNREAYPLQKYFHNLYIDQSNLNHTCPYEDDAIIDGLIYDQTAMEPLPMPNGEYMFKVKVGTQKAWHSEVNFYYQKRVAGS